jgi:glyoxylase-like metal-dependent hydrolase (beta-lactamase superfamily II)
MKAEEVQRVGGRVWYWEMYDPAVKTELSCCAVATAEGLVFIDPIPLAEEAIEELLEEAPAPAGVVVTNGNHRRAAVEFAQRLRVPWMAHAEAVAELEATPDRVLSAGDLVGWELRVYEVAGAAAGEIALHSEATGLHFGDAMINVEPYGLAPLPGKYCRDERAMLAALRGLAELRFEGVTFAHGTPVVVGGARRIRTVLGVTGGV